MKKSLILVWLMAFTSATMAGVPGPPAGGFKAGMAKVSITPDEPLLLNGYAGRDDPSKGVLQPIWAKALAIEDGSGNRVVFISTDLLGLSHVIAEEVCHQADSLYGLKKNQLLLNSSHTHSAPMVWPCLDVIYPELSIENQHKLAAYGAQLTDKLVRIIGEAIRSLSPAVLSTAHGSADFAINRRNVDHPGGPIDHDVPVVKVADANGVLKAVLFGYACHNTTLVADNYLINGDYAGFAQAALEQDHPGIQAMFLMGCAGDQNPAPRGTAEYARQHGRSLADAVEKVLSSKMSPIQSALKTAYTTVDLPYRPFNVEQYRQELAGDNKYMMRRAKLMLDAYNRGWTPKALSYPVQAVRFGKDFCVVALSDEVVVDYSLRTKKTFPGENVFVAGYSHEVMCYIPSLRVLHEGGYEADENMIYYGFPGPFADNVEEKVFGAIRTVMKNVGAAH